MIRNAYFSPLKSGIHKRLLTRRVEVGVVTLTITLIVITCILSLLLLFHANQVATKGYELRQLRQTRHELYLMNQRLEGEVARRQSLDVIQTNPYIVDAMTNVSEIVILEKTTRLAQGSN